MDDLTRLYQKGESDAERAWYVSEYARSNEVRQMYINISTDPASRLAFHRIFRLLLQHDGPVLFHCTSGKDRTGILAAILLNVLGCSTEDIIGDYNASAISFMAKAELFKKELHDHGYSMELQNGVQAILSIVPDTIAAGFQYIQLHYGSDPIKTFQSFGLNEQDLMALREKFLE